MFLQRWKKYRVKVLFVALFTASASVGALVAHMHDGEAWGVWRPLDPPNYFSLTSISWADTANPRHYFYGDVAQNGGNVYDITREIKSILFGEKFTHILETITAQLGIDIKNRTPLDAGILHATGQVAQEKGARTADLYETMQRGLLTESTSFHDYEESTANYEAPRIRSHQRQEVAAAAGKYAQLASSALADNDATREAVHALVAAAANAQGETELRQITEQLNALGALDQAQINALLAAKVQLENDMRRVRLDQEIEWAKQAEDAKIIVTHPYNEERNAVSGYTREKPRGFVAFK